MLGSQKQKNKKQKIICYYCSLKSGEIELTSNSILEFPCLIPIKKEKITHLENSKKCKKRSIDFDFRGEKKEERI